MTTPQLYRLVAMARSWRGVGGGWMRGRRDDMDVQQGTCLGKPAKV
jgi:hypothetical protein